MTKHTDLEKNSPHSILKSFYQHPIEKVVVPFSTKKIGILGKILDVHSSCLQNVLNFSHNGFEIEVLREKLDVTHHEVISTLSSAEAEKVFIQSVALEQLSRSLNFQYIDYSCFQLGKNQIIRFPITLEEQSFDSFLTWLEILSSNESFLHITQDNYLEIYNRLRSRIFHSPKDLFWYQFGDFSSSFLSRDSRFGENKKNSVRIQIHSVDRACERMLVLHLLNEWWSQQSVFLVLGSDGGDIVSQIAENISAGMEPAISDLAEIVTRWGSVLRDREIESVFLITGHFKSKREIEFLNFLLDSSDLPPVSLFYFGKSDEVPYDLALRDFPQNRMAGFAKLAGDPKQIIPKNEEIFVIKIFKCISLPIPRKTLVDLLNPKERMGLNRLIKKGILEESTGSISRGIHFFAIDVSLSRGDWARIIKVFSKIVSSLYLDIHFFLENNRLGDLKMILRHYFSWNVRIDFLKDRKKLLKNLSSAGKDNELLELLVDIFIRENHINLAGELIKKREGTLSNQWKLRAAHIYLAENDLISLENTINDISEKISSEQKDEFYYLSLCLWEKRGEADRSTEFLNQISHERWFHLSSLQICDRYIGAGNWAKAEKIIGQSIDYFRSRNDQRDQLAAQTQLARLRSFEGKFAEAQKRYKNVFLECEIKNYRHDAGSIALGIGDLYWMQDRLKEAESWYQKAATIFGSIGNVSGKIQSDERMADVYLLRGDWVMAQNILQSHTTYFSQKGDCLSLGLCYFRLARLSYMKNRYLKAGPYLLKCMELLSDKPWIFLWNNVKLLQMKINILNDSTNGGSDSSLPVEEGMSLSQKEEFRILQYLKDNGDRASMGEILERLKEIPAGCDRFQLLFFLLFLFKSPDLLKELGSLYKQLGGQSRNYFFFEYQYVLFRDFYTEKEIRSGDLHIFLDTYHFFDRNQRKMDPVMMMYKKMLDQKESNLDIFKSAELVENYRHWRIPNDFFVSFSSEMRKELHYNFIKLVIFNRGDRLFDFSSPQMFEILMDELVNKAVEGLDEMDLDLKGIRELINAQEKAFYPYKQTKVLLWRLSESLMGLLILGFNDEGFRGYDVWGRHGKFLKKFGPLIHRFFEDDFQVHTRLDFIVGESDSIQKLKQQILKVSKVHFSLLITGESGSGKELVAKGVHLLSPRREKPFTPVNAAAIPENLLEAELFGFRKGAFTGATEDKVGLIESASGGTLFLDEVADLPLKLQAKLLRALQEQEIRRLGENRSIPVDIRLISATNRNLEDMITRGLFREDFFFRIQDLTISVPSLRDRTDDIPLLVRHFMEKNEFSPDNFPQLHQVIFNFQQESWKGNVRELESRVKRLITYFPEPVESETIDFPESDGLIEARESLEKNLIQRTLGENNWNKVKTAKQLKISRVYLFNLMRKYSIPLQK